MTADRAALVKRAMDACGSIRMVDSKATEYAEAVISTALNIAMEEAARVADDHVFGGAGVAAALRAYIRAIPDTSPSPTE